MPVRAAPAVVLALLATCAGCGASDRAPDAAATVERFQEALAANDGERACEQLGDDTASKLEQQEQAPCEQAILDVELPSGGRPGKTSVYVTSASVTLDRGGTLFLDEGASGWEIGAAGCRPTSPELPLDCALEN